MSTLAIVVVCVVALLLVLALGGALANSRRRRVDRPRLQASLEEVNRALAAAHAQDRGWEPTALHAAARRAFEHERPGSEIRAQALILVDDRPGTDEDQAVFRFVTDRGTSRLTLGRRGGDWVLRSIE